MRLTEIQITAIRQVVLETSKGKCLTVRVFGSRLDDQVKGGDLDLLLEFSDPVEHPSLLAAKIAARVSRVLQGRKVDVLLSAPNLKRFPIHEIALTEGILI
ncbi:nucleotidyltransferase domain-containing protein [Methylicorpusculum sp.]|uniref:nucleotidyltransferase domain-containing protein n=1 Tax=Methylicorpusculum sp. TaxID=2713644 RepID=UPI00272F7D5D|nr:nucleotidyltransferase domain-containing protein [Methylicorpusculum sp.]MDP2176986.1 nucleotidyltransferase domain-containing protein [Methylicorpusculum sp.]MDP3527803.1 nucleotidyltransferase domain-containing protein [Methylicorpusculum sp.]MDZ4154883.1 nucleotidyltransferase domain-containing protein [Methylicorpusculum sp.]